MLLVNHSIILSNFRVLYHKLYQILLRYLEPTAHNEHKGLPPRCRWWYQPRAHMTRGTASRTCVHLFSSNVHRSAPVGILHLPTGPARSAPRHRPNLYPCSCLLTTPRRRRRLCRALCEGGALSESPRSSMNGPPRRLGGYMSTTEAEHTNMSFAYCCWQR